MYWRTAIQLRENQLLLALLPTGLTTALKHLAQTNTFYVSPCWCTLTQCLGKGALQHEFVKACNFSMFICTLVISNTITNKTLKTPSAGYMEKFLLQFILMFNFTRKKKIRNMFDLNQSNFFMTKQNSGIPARPTCCMYMLWSPHRAAKKCTQLSHLIKEHPSPLWSQSTPDFTQKPLQHTGTVTTQAILLLLLFPREMV